MRNKIILFGVVCAMALPYPSSVANAQSDMVSADQQISYTLLALPEPMREGARVLGYDANGELVLLREGTNDMICVADTPGDDRYSAVCYQKSLDPFIARGRELRAQGVEGAEVLARRHEEMEVGMLELPETGATLYNMTMNLEDFNPETAGPALYAIYTPYATGQSTGLPEAPLGPGAPWIMRAGTPSSHIMIILPQETEDY